MTSLSGLNVRLKQVDKQLTIVESRKQDREKQLQSIIKEVQTLAEDIYLLDRVDQALLAISTKVLGKTLGTTDALVSAGLKLVFDDMNLKFSTKLDKLRGKTAVKFEVDHDGKQFPLLESYGGGVLAIVGVLLRVTTIMALGCRRFLILDETLAHLSEQYIGNASKLLNKICEDLGFTVIMVTHASEFATYANVHYVVGTKGGQTIMTKQTK